MINSLHGFLVVLRWKCYFGPAKRIEREANSDPKMSLFCSVPAQALAMRTIAGPFFF